MNAHTDENGDYVLVLGERVYIDTTGILCPSAYSDEVIEAFDAIPNIRFPDGEIVA